MMKRFCQMISDYNPYRSIISEAVWANIILEQHCEGKVGAAIMSVLVIIASFFFPQQMLCSWDN